MDDVFFGKIAHPLKGGITVLHSYAGHGKYLENIPHEFRIPVDGTLGGISAQGLFGVRLGFVESRAVSDLDAYDSAIRYISYSVTKVLHKSQADPQPRVVIYFSDHGESPLSVAGHDSSRFIDEMARVPFVLYFNSAARAKYPDLYKKYAALALASKTRISTLAQLSSTIMDLLNVRVFGPSVSEIGSDMNGRIAPIISRKTSVGESSIDLNHDAIGGPRIRPFLVAYETRH
jgi:hypothetical protein